MKAGSPVTMSLCAVTCSSGLKMVFVFWLDDDLCVCLAFLPDYRHTADGKGGAATPAFVLFSEAMFICLGSVFCAMMHMEWQPFIRKMRTALPLGLRGGMWSGFR